jgi:hypothetical protein
MPANGENGENTAWRWLRSRFSAVFQTQTDNVMDVISEQRLAAVHPLLADKIRLLAAQLEAQGIVIRVTQGLRTWEEQEALYAQGRTAPGSVVTNAEAGYSWHNFGLAVDVVPLDGSNAPDWNVSHPVWATITKAGQNLGLTSGSAWRSFPDWPHFQLTGNLPISPPPSVRAAYIQGGTAAVWAQTGLDVMPSDVDGEISV